MFRMQKPFSHSSRYEHQLEVFSVHKSTLMQQVEFLQNEVQRLRQKPLLTPHLQPPTSPGTCKTTSPTGSSTATAVVPNEACSRVSAFINQVALSQLSAFSLLPGMVGVGENAKRAE
jgi:hypothetical protein